MSNTSEVAKADGFQRFGSRVFNFRLPTCRPTVDYQASFKSSVGTPEAASFITKLTQLRLEMTGSLYSSPGSYDQKIKALDAYLVQVFRLSDAFALQTLKLDKQLHFEWRGAISDKIEAAKSSDILFEILFLLHTKAILHSTAAKALLDTDPISFLSDAAKHLVEASSIMSHMATNIGNGTWNRGFCKSSPNPPELSEHMCAGLAMLFKGEAQALSFMKAATGGSAPASIKSRLAVGVVKTMMQAFEHLSLTPESLMRHADLLSFVHVTREFYTALAYQHSAQAYVEKTEVGNAIAFCLAAKTRLTEQRSSSKPVWSVPGLPKFAGAYAELGNAVAYIVDTVNQIQATAERDNKFVYFQPVPGPNSSNSNAGLPLPDLPAEASVMNPGPFVEPDRSSEPRVTLEYKAKPSVFSSMFSGLMGATASSPAAAAAEGVACAGAADAGATAPPASAPSQAPSPGTPTDEEYARTLQRQYDTEAAASTTNTNTNTYTNTNTTSPSSSAGAGGAQQPSGPPAPPAPRYNSLV